MSIALHFGGEPKQNYYNSHFIQASKMIYGIKTSQKAPIVEDSTDKPWYTQHLKKSNVKLEK